MKEKEWKKCKKCKKKKKKYYEIDIGRKSENESMKENRMKNEKVLFGH